MKLYTFLVCLFIRWAVRFTRARGRVVHYTHGGRLYMTRYALCGHLTGDGQTKFRRWFPNLYVHQMHAPDLDPSLHDHPWLWALSFIMLGGYREERKLRPIGKDFESPYWVLDDVGSRWLKAPAINRLSGKTFHRVAELENAAQLKARGALWYEGKRGRYTPEGGTWTLFVAGPGRNKKQWGYLVARKGYMSHQTRHLQIEGKEVREPAPLKRATGKALDALGLHLGLKRRSRWFLFSESDDAFRSRMHDFACSIAGCP